MTIENPKRRIVEDLKIRNKDNMKIVAGEYFGNKYTYADTFKMFEDYKKAFIEIDGHNEDTITISCPSTIASVNAFYGAMDANKIVNMTGPGFLRSYTERYTKELNSKGKLPYVYVVCKNKDVDEDKLKQELYELCKAELPEYAMPIGFSICDSLPVTNIGKIDYRKLEDMANEE